MGELTLIGRGVAPEAIARMRAAAGGTMMMRLPGVAAEGVPSVTDGLDLEATAEAEEACLRWIKSLRSVEIEPGRTFREQFVHRGESLWWFAELYLHKRTPVVETFRLSAALERVLDREAPSRIVLLGRHPLARHLLLEAGRARRVPVRIVTGPRNQLIGAAKRARDRFALHIRRWFHLVTLVADATVRRLFARWNHPTRASESERADEPRRPRVLVFSHAAFWRPSPERGSREFYLGRILAGLTARLGSGSLEILSVGPRTIFKGRSWRARWREFRDPAGVATAAWPIGLYSTPRVAARMLPRLLRCSADAHTLDRSQALRGACRVGPWDFWPVFRREFRGMALLQFPWAVRTMDEAGAALDTLRPSLVLTYAEAGGWGRAIVLESRRRGLPSVAVQHGFIYPRWLNYRHEPDEMLPAGSSAEERRAAGSEIAARRDRDRGFPYPTRTLLFDRFAEEHLRTAGHFPPEALQVTGNPRLDDLLETARLVDRAAVRARYGVPPAGYLAVVAARYRDIGRAFPALLAAVRARPDLVMVVKCHQAETAEPYERDIAAAGASNVQIGNAGESLFEILPAARLIVTANSTAAIEAMFLDIPGLVVALPNNLSAFVAGGALAGATRDADIGPAVSSLVYEEQARERLAQGRAAWMARYDMHADGQATARSVEATLALLDRQAPAMTLQYTA